MSIPGWWQPRHVEAFRAWQEGDLERLCELCGQEIGRAARKAAARESLDYGVTQELCQYGAQGVEKAASRYDPAKERFQVYAQQDIYWETRRGAQALVAYSTGREEPGSRKISAERLGPALARVELDDFRRWIRTDLDKETVEHLRDRIEEDPHTLARTAGAEKVGPILAECIGRIVVDAWSRPPSIPPSKRRREPLELSGPLHVLGCLKRGRASNRQLARMLNDAGIPASDKTVKAWRARMEDLGEPPRDVLALYEYLSTVINRPRNSK